MVSGSLYFVKSLESNTKVGPYRSKGLGVYKKHTNIHSILYKVIGGDVKHFVFNL